MKIHLMEDSFGEGEISAVHDCMQSGRYTQGKRVTEFEEAFASWNGGKRAVMVNSGSSANLLAVDALLPHFGLAVRSNSPSLPPLPRLGRSRSWSDVLARPSGSS